jgi:transposase-like protein
MLHSRHIQRTFIFALVALACGSSVAQDSSEDAAWSSERIRQAGLREVNSSHLRMITDLPVDPEVDELPVIFDRAIPQWFEGFAIPPGPLPKEKLKLLLFQDRSKMEQLGLIDASLPPFPYGYQRGPNMYVAEPPSSYYRRHLVLHEGTHWFMETFIGGYGPPWIAEGMAERWATHRWDGTQLQMKTIPGNRDDYPYWGRFRFIREQLAAGKELDEVCRHLEIAESTWHRWLAQYGGMKANDAKRLKELESENARLKKLLAEAELDKSMLKELAEGNF